MGESRPNQATAPDCQPLTEQPGNLGGGCPTPRAYGRRCPYPSAVHEAFQFRTYGIERRKLRRLMQG